MSLRRHIPMLCSLVPLYIAAVGHAGHDTPQIEEIIRSGTSSAKKVRALQNLSIESHNYAQLFTPNAYDETPYEVSCMIDIHCACEIRRKVNAPLDAKQNTRLHQALMKPPQTHMQELGCNDTEAYIQRLVRSGCSAMKQNERGEAPIDIALRQAQYGFVASMCAHPDATVVEDDIDLTNAITRQEKKKTAVLKICNHVLQTPSQSVQVPSSLITFIRDGIDHYKKCYAEHEAEAIGQALITPTLYPVFIHLCRYYPGRQLCHRCLAVAMEHNRSDCFATFATYNPDYVSMHEAHDLIMRAARKDIRHIDLPIQYLCQQHSPHEIASILGSQAHQQSPIIQAISQNSVDALRNILHMYEAMRKYDTSIASTRSILQNIPRHTLNLASFACADTLKTLVQWGADLEQTCHISSRKPTTLVETVYAHPYSFSNCPFKQFFYEKALIKKIVTYSEAGHVEHTPKTIEWYLSPIRTYVPGAIREYNTRCMHTNSVAKKLARHGVQLAAHKQAFTDNLKRSMQPHTRNDNPSIDACINAALGEPPSTPSKHDNIRDFDAMTPLMWAICQNHTALAHHLLDFRVEDVCQQDAKGKTPFIFACERGNMSLVERLLKERKQDKEIGRGLRYAARNGHQYTVYIILRDTDGCSYKAHTVSSEQNHPASTLTRQQLAVAMHQAASFGQYLSAAAIAVHMNTDGSHALMLDADGSNKRCR